MSTPPESELKVLSFNCWGLKYISKDRRLRFRAIADELADTTYDVVALQEVWVRADFELIRVKVSANLPFAKFFYAGALGSGTAIFSRFPIIETSSFSYSHNGSPIDVGSGDWIVGKGLFSAVLHHPVLHEVEVFNTHMCALGGDEGPEVHRVSRVTAAWELTKRIRQSAAHGRHVILTGDFNSIPDSLVMSIIREHGRLTDSWAASHDNSFLPEADAIHEPHHALSAFGVTADSPLNTWTAHKKLDGVAARWKGKRLDYVLYRGPARPRARKRRSHQSTSSEGAPQIHPFDLEPRLHCTSSKVAMTAKVPGMHMSLSDHFAVEAVLSIQYPSPSSPTMPPPPAAPSVWDNGVNITGNGSGASPSYRDNDHTVHLNGSSPPLSSGPPSPTSHSPPHPQDSTAYDDMGEDIYGEPGLSPRRVEDMLVVLSGAYQASARRSREHLLVFGLCAVSLVGLVIGSAWQPLSGANPVMVAVGGLLTWLGTTMLYSGFVWGNWEANTLLTVVEELDLFSRRRAIRASHESRRSS